MPSQVARTNNTGRSVQNPEDFRRSLMEFVQTGSLASSSQEIGDVGTRAQTQSRMTSMLAEAGPEVLAAASEFMRQYSEITGETFEADGDDAHDDDGDAYEDAATVDLDSVAPMVEFTPQQERLVVAASALVASRNSTAGLPAQYGQNGGRWNRFTNLAMHPAQMAAIQSMAPAIFGLFPCFQQQASRTSMPRAVGNIKAVWNIEPTVGANPMMLPAITHQARQNTPEGDLDQMANWIRSNALAVSASKIRFNMFPGYAPKVLFAMSEDETFLLVEENQGGPGDYSFDTTTGDLRIKTSQPIKRNDILVQIDTPYMDGATIHSDDLDPLLYTIINGNGITRIVYRGEDDIPAGTEIIANMSRNSFGHMVPDLATLGFDAMGQLYSDQPTGSPVKGRYIYNWPGGRQFYASNLPKLEKLMELMSASGGMKVNFGAPVAAIQTQAHNVDRQIQARREVPMPMPEPTVREREVPRQAAAAAAPAPAPAPAAPVQKPVAAPQPLTMPQQSQSTAKTVSMDKVVGNLLGALRVDLGFSLTRTTIDGVATTVVSKPNEDGSITVARSENPAVMVTLAQDMVIETWDVAGDPSSARSAGDIVTKGMRLEEIVDAIANSGIAGRSFGR
jgi:hypothetical protein